MGSLVQPKIDPATNRLITIAFFMSDVFLAKEVPNVGLSVRMDRIAR
jgi:hypothetical protein